MPDGFLFFFFVTSSLPAVYWGRMGSALYDPYIAAFNEAGFTLLGLAVTVIMAALSFYAFFLHALLKDRQVDI